MDSLIEFAAADTGARHLVCRGAARPIRHPRGRPTHVALIATSSGARGEVKNWERTGEGDVDCRGTLIDARPVGDRSGVGRAGWSGRSRVRGCDGGHCGR